MAAPIFTKETLVKGQPARIRCVELLGQTFVIEGGALTRVSLEDEWFEDIDDSAGASVAACSRARQHPTCSPSGSACRTSEPGTTSIPEWEEIAVLPIQSYEHWWKNQIKSRVRNQIRKAEKDGLMVKEVAYDDEFVKGMTAIFNESPVRQGRPFWHYGKSFETVKRSFALRPSRAHDRRVLRR